MIKAWLFPLTFLFSIHSLLAQKQKEAIQFTAGIEAKALIPIPFFTMNSLALTDSSESFSTDVEYTGGFGFGAIIRAKLSPFWNIESGIGYTRRKYKFDITSDSSRFSSSSTLRVIGYELPIKGLIYIQMGDDIFMDVALGVSADFFASDLEVFGGDPASGDSEYVVRAFKRNWLQGAVIGNVGVEWRSEDSGIFYIGANIHQPFGDVMLFRVSFFENGNPPAANIGLAALDGAYASLDFRYFFPIKKETGPKVRRVIPTWK